MTGPVTTARTLIDRLGIRMRIAGGSLLIAILIAVAAGIVLNAQIERIVRDGTSSVLSSDSAPYVVALQTEPDDSFDAPGPSQLVAVVAPDGSTPINTLPASLAGKLPDVGGSGQAHDVRVGDASFIVLSTTVAVAGRDWVVVAARDAQEETTVLAQMRTLLFTGLAVIAVGAAGTAWALTSLSLGPVRRLRRSADALSAGSSSELLAVGEARDEISDLARTLNELIERLRDSARRERQLVSDASHELRTPIALLNTQLQVAVAEASSVEQMVRDVDGARRNVARLAALVTSLLELSAIEAAHDGVRSSIGALDREADDATDRARFRAQDTAISILYDGPELLASDDGTEDSGSFPIGAESFGRILDNLLNNALRAVGHGGVIDVQLTVGGGFAWLLVTDTGGGMDPAFEPFALDRFTRQDASRTGGQGTGLGLAIVAALVRNAGGTIELDNRPGDGLTIRIGLPAVQAAPSPGS